MTLVDVPGFLPGLGQEHGGSFARARNCCTRIARRPCPSDRHHPQGVRWSYRCYVEQAHSADLNLAWPTAEIAVMGIEGAVNIVFRSELSPRTIRCARVQLERDYRERCANPTSPPRAAIWTT